MAADERELLGAAGRSARLDRASLGEMVASLEPTRPLLRGMIHQAAFLVSLVVGTLLIVAAEGERRQVAAAAFAGAVAACFGTSALYHRVVWPPRLRAWMRRLDHAGVFLLIAGTYTPIGLLVLDGAWRWLVLGFAWGSAGTAIVLSFVWSRAPKWVAAAIGLGIGWGSVAILPQVVARVSGGGVALLIAGGLLYSIGAVVYARRRPDPRPSVFGYHELFHALTIVAVACQYVAMAFFVIHVG
jgi:hemolysin III